MRGPPDAATEHRMASTLSRALTLAAVTAGGAALARGVLARRRALSAVAAELRHPALYLPLHLGSRSVLRLMTAAAQRRVRVVPVERGRRLAVTLGGPPAPERGDAVVLARTDLVGGRTAPEETHAVDARAAVPGRGCPSGPFTRRLTRPAAAAGYGRATPQPLVMTPLVVSP